MEFERIFLFLVVGSSFDVNVSTGVCIFLQDFNTFLTILLSTKPVFSIGNSKNHTRFFIRNIMVFENVLSILIFLPLFCTRVS